MLKIPGHNGNANQMTLRFYFPLVKMAIVNDTNTTKRWQGCSEKGTLIHCGWECKLAQPVTKAVWRFLKKLKLELPFNPAILLLGMYLKKCEPGYDRATYTSMFICSAVHNSQDLDTAQMPHTGEWIKIIWYLYTMEYIHSAMKKLCITW
jgi:hypothetical protein